MVPADVYLDIIFPFPFPYIGIIAPVNVYLDIILPLLLIALMNQSFSFQSC